MSPKPDRRHRYSLRRRLLVRMATGFGIIIGISVIALWSYARNAANATYDLLLNGAALAIQERSYAPATGPSVDIPYSALEMLGLAPDDRVFYRIFLDTGVTLTGDPKLPLPPDMAPSDEARYFDALHEGEMARFILLGRRIPGQRYAKWIIVQVGHTRLARNDRESSLVTNGLGALLLISGVGLAFVWLGINRALAPLTAIEEDLRAREPADLTPLAAMPPREVESLINSINGFIQRLAVNKEHTQNFIADMAHQTRTSLSALQGMLDSAQRQTDPALLANRLDRAREQTNRTVRLTNQLLAHAMVIHRAENMPLATIDLVPVVRGILEETLRQTFTRDIEYGLDLDGTPGGRAWIAGDPVSLREALRNLLDNAAKHGPASNRIDLSVTVTPAPPDEGAGSEGRAGTVTLSVEDAGPGIPADQRDAALERFRSHGATSGSGLGLAIARAVAVAHHGTMTLGDSRLGGLRVDLILPESQAPVPPETEDGSTP